MRSTWMENGQHLKALSYFSGQNVPFIHQLKVFAVVLHSLRTGSQIIRSTKREESADPRLIHRETHTLWEKQWTPSSAHEQRSATHTQRFCLRQPACRRREHTPGTEYEREEKSDFVPTFCRGLIKCASKFLSERLSLESQAHAVERLCVCVTVTFA